MLCHTYTVVVYNISLLIFLTAPCTVSAALWARLQLLLAKLMLADRLVYIRRIFCSTVERRIASTAGLATWSGGRSSLLSVLCYGIYSTSVIQSDEAWLAESPEHLRELLPDCAAGHCGVSVANSAAPSPSESSHGRLLRLADVRYASRVGLECVGAQLMSLCFVCERRNAGAWGQALLSFWATTFPMLCCGDSVHPREIIFI